MSYPELERAMFLDQFGDDNIENLAANRTERANLKKYRTIRARNLHKMNPIPVCRMNEEDE